MLLALVLLSLFFTMLLFPETVFQGACDGLLLWYQILIPTLFSLSYCHRTFVENRWCCCCLPSAFPSFPSTLWNFFLWKFRRSVRLFMRLSNGCKNHCRPSSSRKNFLLKKLLTCCPSVIMQVHLLLLLFLF